MPVTKDNWKERAEKAREKIDKHPERLETVKRVLETYSKEQNSLSADLKDLFRECEGSPFQNTLYNALIYSISFERWDGLPAREKEDILVNTGAELYYYQRMLNKCIGRTFYDSSVKDIPLITHIAEEILYRFPFMKADFDAMISQSSEDLKGSKNYSDYCEKVFSRYSNNKKYGAKPKHSKEKREHFTAKVREIFDNNKMVNEKNKKIIHYIQDAQTFWLAVTDKRAKSSVSMFTGEMTDGYGRRKFPTKDDLFVFAIALKLKEEEFNNLVDEAAKDCGSNTRYAYNTENLRDALILSVIRSIDDWYKQIEAETGLTPGNPDFVSALLFAVDRMLYMNLCDYQGELGFDHLLYHSFLIDHGVQSYTSNFKSYIAEHKINKSLDKLDILDFYEQVKRKMSDNRNGVKKVKKASKSDKTDVTDKIDILDEEEKKKRKQDEMKEKQIRLQRASRRIYHKTKQEFGKETELIAFIREWKYTEEGKRTSNYKDTILGPVTEEQLDILKAAFDPNINKYKFKPTLNQPEKESP